MQVRPLTGTLARTTVAQDAARRTTQQEMTVREGRAHDTRPGLVYSLVWIAFIVGAAFANRHFLLRRASRGVLGDGGTGEGPHQGPHLHE